MKQNICAMPRSQSLIQPPSALPSVPTARINFAPSALPPQPALILSCTHQAWSLVALGSHMEAAHAPLQFSVVYPGGEGGGHQTPMHCWQKMCVQGNSFASPSGKLSRQIKQPSAAECPSGTICASHILLTQSVKDEDAPPLVSSGELSGAYVQKIHDVGLRNRFHHSADKRSRM